MRNYFKTRLLQIYPYSPPNGQPTWDPLVFYVVFGGTDEQLLFYQLQTQEFLLTIEPTYIFYVPVPQVVWFELDLENFILLLQQAPGVIWGNTRLNNLFPKNPGSDLTPLLWDCTRVESEGSPRKTWSHGE